MSLGLFVSTVRYLIFKNSFHVNHLIRSEELNRVLYYVLNSSKAHCPNAQASSALFCWEYSHSCLRQVLSGEGWTSGSSLGRHLSTIFSKWRGNIYCIFITLFFMNVIRNAATTFAIPQPLIC